MNLLRFSARSLKREFRHGELRTLAAALLLAVAALTAVTTLGQRVERAILASAAELIGGDLGVSARTELPRSFSEKATELRLRSNASAEFPSVIFVNERSQLCQVLATDGNYPLRGKLRITDGTNARDASAPQPGDAYADHAVLVALGLTLGDHFELAGKPLRIAGEIERQPDGGQLFALAPRMIVALSDAQKSGLLGSGSRARHRLMLAGEADSLESFRQWAQPLLPSGAEFVTVAQAQQNLRTAFERGEGFLRLAALLSALLSGIAIALAAQRYARRKTDEVALLRALGLGKSAVLASLSLSLALLALPACVLGAMGGLLLQEVVLRYAQDVLASTAPAPSLLPALAAMGIGLAVLAGFALPPLARLRDVPPMRVFQRSLELRARRFDLLYLLPPLVALMLIWSESGSTRIAAALAGTLLSVTLASLLCAGLLILVLRRLGRGIPGALRFGLANLARRRGLSLVQATSLALSFTALLILSVVGPGLLNAWRADLPTDTPNRFLINLQPDQRASVEQRLQALQVESLNVMPMAVGKLVAINGKAPRAEDYEDRRAIGWINGETRLSWSDQLPPSNQLVEGVWFDPRQAAPSVSVDRMWVDMFHLKLGDTLGISIGEQRIDAAITSIRNVDWSSFRVNFFLLLNPASAAQLPHGLVASFYIPPTSAPRLAGFAHDYPNLSLIDIDAVLDRVRDIIERVTRAVTWVLGFSLLAGVLVLIAALNVSADERRFEIALLRTLGAHRRQLLAAMLGEFALLGLIAGLIAAAGAISAGWSLAGAVFKIAWSPPWSPLFGGVVAAVALVTLAGWLGTRRIARTSPMLILRRE
ncbi:MAG: FtsX-like permease family protein [Tahibacter sp.]